MSHACTPILVGVVSLVSEILLPSKTAKFPFQTMDYIVHGHQKIQSIGIGSKNSCKYGLMSHACTPILVGVVSSVSEILLPSKTAKFPFLTMDYSPWSPKNSIDQNQLKKFMQVGIDVTCMHTNFGGCSLFGFGDTASFKNGQISLSDHGLYSPWSSKNLIDRNRLKKFMQVGIDVTCMHTNYGGCGPSSFGDTATFKNGKISLSDHGL